MYTFERPLQEAVIIKRNSRFSMTVDLNGLEIAAHCPTTGRIGNIDTSGIACLLSHSDDIKRKLPYTVEAISCDEPEKADKNWVGINQILSNRLIEHFLRTRELGIAEGDCTEIKREVSLGISKLDFKVGDTYLEVKTPLNDLQVVYGPHIKTKPVAPFSSTERFTKHIDELANSLKEHERAYLLSVYQYMITDPKERMRSENYETVSAAIERVHSLGVRFLSVEMKFSPAGVELHKVYNTF